jgi:hypothetical protein
MADPSWTPPPSGSRALADRLADADPGTTAPQHTVRQPAVEPSRRRGTGWLIAALVVAGVAVIVAAASVYVAYDNANRAEGWEDRVFRLERNAEVLNGLLVERSTQLNERTRELNRVAATVTRQQNALVRSESDVESLTDRQRELAAEKAAVEDSRAALALQSRELEQVADTLVSCNTGLLELFGYVIDGDRVSADAIVDAVSESCANAESRLAGYRSRYG